MTATVIPLRPRIYAYCAKCQDEDTHYIQALGEDGNLLVTHLSSSHEWGHRDINAPGYQALYAAQYPRGFTVVWVHAEHPEVLRATELNRVKREAGGAA